MRYITFISTLAFMLLSPSIVSAQGHDMYCDKADSTAALQECLKQHLSSAQKRLSKVYQSLSDKYEGDNAEALSNLQRQWLAYRDAECTWEAEQSPTPALKRTNELSCMARVTDDRADILSTLLMDAENPEQTREYGSFPRWMNVIAKEKQNVFWNYHNRMRGDLNCDGEDEHFMMGISVNEGTDKIADESDFAFYNTSVTLAIASYPSIGRPQATYLEFPVLNVDEAENLCDPYASMHIEEKQVPAEEQESEEEDKTCNTHLVIKGKKCTSKSVVWTGKTYSLDIKESDEKETESQNE